MSDHDGTVSQSQYAHSRGVTQSAINQAVAEGRIPVREDGRIVPAEADATWGRRREQRAADAHASAAAEARRETALLNTTIAKTLMTRRRVEQLRARLVERDKVQAVIGVLIERLLTSIPDIAKDCAPEDAPIMRDAVAAILDDLDGLHAEALKVTQRE